MVDIECQQTVQWGINYVPDSDPSLSANNDLEIHNEFVALKQE